MTWKFSEALGRFVDVADVPSGSSNAKAGREVIVEPKPAPASPPATPGEPPSYEALITERDGNGYVRRFVLRPVKPSS
jgi:hypothetical protein